MNQEAPHSPEGMRASDRQNPYTDLVIDPPKDADVPREPEAPEQVEFVEVPGDLEHIPPADSPMPTDAEQLEAVAQDLDTARLDPLTGLLSQSGLDLVTKVRYGVSLDQPNFAGPELTASAKGKRVIILNGDLCDMKLTNDAFGHREGDQSIARAAQRFHDALRSQDVVARPHGDELVAIIDVPDDLADDEAEQFAAELVARVRAAASIKPVSDAQPGRPDQVVAIGAVMGTIRALTPEERQAIGSDAPQSTLQQLFDESDQEMYAHKLALAEAGLISPRESTKHVPAKPDPDRSGRVEKAAAYYRKYGGDPQ